EWHKRFAFPIAAIVFALVGFPLAVRSHRGGRSIALGGSLVIMVTYYLLATSLEGPALDGRLPEWAAIWTPNIVFAAFGVLLLLATAREWRAPRARGLWRLVATLGQAVPRLGRRFAHLAIPGRNSTHILDRYLVREHVTFIGVGVAVAATLFLVIDLVQTLDRFLRMKPP